MKLAVPTMGQGGAEAQGADAIVAAGMGMRPMMGFANAGITVYFDNQTPKAGDVALLAAEGKLPIMGADQACQH